MYEQDYIMRLIKEMVRAVLNLLFHIDTESQLEEQLKDTEQKTVLEELLNRADEGDINGAENRLYELVTDRKAESLQMALLFYSHLNDKDDDFLKAHDYSREEIKEGLKTIMSDYGLDGMAEAFL